MRRSRVVNTSKNPLHEAIENNRVETVEVLLNRLVDINARNNEDMTPLHVAAIKGQTIIVEKLLSKGACVNSTISKTKRRLGFTPLHCAVEAGNREITELLLKNNASVDARTKNKKTPLEIAVYNGNATIADQLLNHGASVKTVCTSLAEDSIPLNLAIAKGNLELVKVLLKHGAYVSPKNKNAKSTLKFALDANQPTVVAYIFVSRLCAQNKKNRCFLLDAIDTRTEYNDIVADLIKSNPGIFSHVDSQHSRYVDASIHLFLHAAIEKGFSGVVEDFLKCGVELCVLNRRAEDYTLLHAAVENKRHKIAELLIDYGANIDAKYKNHETPLSYAFRNADAKMTRLLLIKGANQSPEVFNAAVKTGSKKIVEVFLNICSKINVNAKDNSGDTALHCVALFNGSDENKSEIARLLLNRGANPNIRNKNGLTTLHVAVEEGYTKLVEVLLENNENIHLLRHRSSPEDIGIKIETILKRTAKINAKSPCGMTALHIASKENNGEIVENLLKHGADIYVKTQFLKTPFDLAFENSSRNTFESLIKRGADISTSCLLNAIPPSSNPHENYERSRLLNFYISMKVMHLIRMEAANRYVGDETLPCAPNKSSQRELLAYRKACITEVEKTKIEKINNTVCFHDILTKSIHRVARYSRNKEVAQVLVSKDLSAMFPIYCRMIEYHFRRGQQRGSLMYVALDSFNSMTAFSLPMDVLITEIFAYLTNEDLENLIEAKHGTGMYR